MKKVLFYLCMISMPLSLICWDTRRNEKQSLLNDYSESNNTFPGDITISKVNEQKFPYLIRIKSITEPQKTLSTYAVELSKQDVNALIKDLLPSQNLNEDMDKKRVEVLIKPNKDALFFSLYNFPHSGTRKEVANAKLEKLIESIKKLNGKLVKNKKISTKN